MSPEHPPVRLKRVHPVRDRQTMRVMEHRDQVAYRDLLVLLNDAVSARLTRIIDEVITVEAGATVAQLHDPRPHLVRSSRDSDRTRGIELCSRNNLVARHSCRQLGVRRSPAQVPSAHKWRTQPHRHCRQHIQDQGCPRASRPPRLRPRHRASPRPQRGTDLSQRTGLPEGRQGRQGWSSTHPSGYPLTGISDRARSLRCAQRGFVGTGISNWVRTSAARTFSTPVNGYLGIGPERFLVPVASR